MRKILLALLAMAISTPAYTLEVFLNANRSDTGTIGYVDIDRVFNTYSETKASKLDLEKEVRRKEEELERRRTTIYNRKAKATKLRQEKELALILPEMLENQAKKAQAEEKMRADAEKIRREQEELAQKEEELRKNQDEFRKNEEKFKQDSENLKQESEKVAQEMKVLQKQKYENEKQRFILESRQNGVPEDNIQAMVREKFPDIDENSEKKPENEQKTAKKDEKTVKNAENDTKKAENVVKKDKNNENTTENKEKTSEQKDVKKEEKSPENSEKTAKNDEKKAENAINPQKNDTKTEKKEEQADKPEMDAYQTVPIPELPLSQYGEPIEEEKTPLYTINIPGIGDFSFSVSTDPVKIQDELLNLENQIRHDEDAAKQYEERAEKELAEYEEECTRQLLGKIYSALKKLAQRETISVIVDKRNILYGKDTVDLTQKLIDMLETPEEE